MSLLQKITSHNVIKLKKCFCGVRTVYLTAAKFDVKNIIESTINISIPNVSLSEFFIPKFETYRSNTAVECSDTGKKYTYQQVLEKTRSFSMALTAKLKLQKGDTVAIFSRNDPDYVIAGLGIIRGGMIVTTLNPMYTPDELAHQLTDSEAKIIIAQITLVSVLKQALIKMKKQIPTIVLKQHESDSIPEGAICFKELTEFKGYAPNIEILSSDLVAMPYSSGTTGLPKGVELTNKNLVSNILQTLHPSINIFTEATDNYQSIIPLVLPMYHIYGFFVGILTGLYTGSKIITVPKFTPEKFIKILRGSDVTHIFGAPPLALFLMNHEGLKKEYFQNLSVIVNGAAPLRYTDEVKLMERVSNGNTRFKQAYGMTESSPVLVITPEGFQSSVETDESIGSLVPNTAAKVISTEQDSGTALGQGEKGEILVKGPQVMKGYHNKPDETEKAFKDGWLRTGDIGYFNKDGILFLTDRLKELIKVKGFQVPPAELEGVSRTHPEVQDVGVIGIPHPTKGEVPRAYVVPRNKNKFNVKEFQEYVASKVAQYKQLVGGVEIVDHIPRNPSGKILRRQLKQQFLEKES